MRNTTSTPLALAMAVALAGCGGGSDTSGGQSSPPNELPPIIDDSPTNPAAPRPEAAELDAAGAGIGSVIALADYVHAAREAALSHIATIEATGPIAPTETGGDSTTVGPGAEPQSDESAEAYDVACAQSGTLRVRYWQDHDGDGRIAADDALSIAPQGCRSSVGGPIVTAERIDWTASGDAREVFALELELATYPALTGLLTVALTPGAGDTVSVSGAALPGALILDSADGQIVVGATTATIPATGYDGLTVSTTIQHFGPAYEARRAAGYGAVDVETEGAITESAGALSLTDGSYTVRALDSDGERASAIAVTPAADPAFLRVRIDEDNDDAAEIDRVDVPQTDVIGRLE